MKLVLAKEHVSNNVVGRILLLSRSVDQEVELGGAEIVSGLRNGDHEAVPDIPDQQDFMGTIERHKGGLVGSILDSQIVQLMF